MCSVRLCVSTSHPLVVIDLNHGKSAHSRPGSMKLEMARAAPWSFWTASPDWTLAPSLSESNF